MPEDRLHDGLVSSFTVAENLVLDLYDRKPFSKGVSTSTSTAIRQNADDRVAEFDVRTSSIEHPASTLSGGNQQKVVLARELSRPLKLLVVAQPTRGLDVGSMEFMHSRIVAERDAGAAVILVSSELDEVLGLADRIGVMYRGRIIGEVPGWRPTPEEIGLLMAGTVRRRATRRRRAATRVGPSTPAQRAPAPEPASARPATRPAARWHAAWATTILRHRAGVRLRDGHRRGPDRHRRPGHPQAASLLLLRTRWDTFTDGLQGRRHGLRRAVPGRDLQPDTGRERHAGRLPRTRSPRRSSNATPLILGGLSVGLAFRAGLFNIGGQGQIIMGAIFAGYVGFHWHLPPGLHLIAAILAGMLGGALWGGLAGLLKARTGAHEVITTIMLNYIAFFLLAYLLSVKGFQAPPYGQAISNPVDHNAQLPPLLGSTMRVHAGLFLALLAAAADLVAAQAQHARASGCAPWAPTRSPPVPPA